MPPTRLRERQAEQAHLAHLPDDVVRERVVLVELADHRRDDVVGELAHARPQGFVLLVEREVRHVQRPPRESDGRDAVAAPGEVTVLADRGGVAGDQLVAQLVRLDDRVDDELAGQPDDVDVLLVLGALGRDERGPLVSSAIAAILLA